MPCRVRGKTEKQISVKSGVESGEWHTGVEFIHSECARWRWLGGGMQESGKKNQLLDGNSNPKEASKNCTLMAGITEAVQHLNSFSRSVFQFGLPKDLSPFSTSYPYQHRTMPLILQWKNKEEMQLLQGWLFCFVVHTHTIK